jgi:hypothetical protein
MHVGMDSMSTCWDLREQAITAEHGSYKVEWMSVSFVLLIPIGLFIPASASFHPFKHT